MKTRIGLVLVLAAGCSAAWVGSSAQAQPPRGPGGGPGGFAGRGGFAAGFGFGGLAEVLRRGDVRRELELLDDQVAQLQKLAEGRGERMREAFAGLRDVPADQRREKTRELFQTFQQDQEAEIGKILLPHQMKRARQLETQLRMQGGRGILSDQVAQDLALSEEQKEKLRAKAGQLQEEVRKKLAEMRAQAQEEMLQLLTPEQQAKWKDLVGEPFEFQREEFPRPAAGPQGNAPAGRPPRGERPQGRPKSDG